MGIKRKRGRPRKFPGYLVREMRLKKNRSEFNDLLREHESGERDERDEKGNGEFYASWEGHGLDGQSLLEVVAAQRRDGEGEGLGPSGLGRADEEIREVFGVPEAKVE